MRAAFVASVALLLATPAPTRARSRRLPKSVEVHKGQIRIYSRPSVRASIRGYIAKAGRYPVLKRFGSVGGCKVSWYQIGPEAYACSSWLLPRRAAPTRLRRVEATWRPGPYFGARGGRFHRLPSYARGRLDLMMGRAKRLKGLVGVEAHSRRLALGKSFVVTRSGGWVRARRLVAFRPSRLLGVTLGRSKLPIAFARARAPLLKLERGRLVPSGALLSKYAVARVRKLATVAGEKVAYLPAGIVRRRRVSIAFAPPAPPAGVGAREKWVDVDGTERIVLARRGRKVVRVMLGSLAPKTPVGSFRVEQKIVYKDMRTQYGRDPFYLEAVPYVVFFKGDFAFHGAYWHDAFGSHISHGCINLSLADARFVYDWLGPRLPAGFVSIYPTAADPGGLVRVRGRMAASPPRPAPGSAAP